jgi:hypothetical protein
MRRCRSQVGPDQRAFQIVQRIAINLLAERDRFFNALTQVLLSSGQRGLASSPCCQKGFGS